MSSTLDVPERRIGQRRNAPRAPSQQRLGTQPPVVSHVAPAARDLPLIGWRSGKLQQFGERRGADHGAGTHVFEVGDGTEQIRATNFQVRERVRHGASNLEVLSTSGYRPATQNPFLPALLCRAPPGNRQRLRERDYRSRNPVSSLPLLRASSRAAPSPTESRKPPASGRHSCGGRTVPLPAASPRYPFFAASRNPVGG